LRVCTVDKVEPNADDWVRSVVSAAVAGQSRVDDRRSGQFRQNTGL